MTGPQIRTAAIILCTGFWLLAGIAYALAEGCDDISIPPPQYDHLSQLQPLIRIVDFWDVDGVCTRMLHGPRENGRYWGCNLGRVIVIPRIDADNIDLTCQQRIFRHELGHRNGWPADHPGERFVS